LKEHNLLSGQSLLWSSGKVAATSGKSWETDGALSCYDCSLIIHYNSLSNAIIPR
jgi:hypothetical protein